MKASLLACLAVAAPSFAAVLDIIPSAQDVLTGVDSYLHSNPHLEVYHDHIDPATQSKSKLCVLHPLGGDQFDDDNFKRAVLECGNGGIVRLPDAN